MSSSTLFAFLPCPGYLRQGVLPALIFFGVIVCPLLSGAQDTSWTASAKKTLIGNYQRTQQAINAETAQLTPAQWAFRESSNSWTIGQVLEHLNMWQLITLYNARNIIDGGPRPELAAFVGSDSANVLFIYEQKKHISPDFTIPTGFIPGVKNLDIFNFNCSKIISGIEENQRNFKVYFRGSKEIWLENLYQTYAIQYGHVERHLLQIKRIKTNQKFPSR
jgi:DinB family protein